MYIDQCEVAMGKSVQVTRQAQGHCTNTGERKMLIGHCCLAQMQNLMGRSRIIVG